MHSSHNDGYLNRLFALGIVLSLATWGRAGVYIEFSGRMTGNYDVPSEAWRHMIDDNYAWKWFENGEFTATSGDAGFLEGKDLSKLKLLTGTNGLAAAYLTWFAKTGTYSDHRLYTDGGFEIDYDGAAVATGICDIEADVDYLTSETTGSINGRVGALFDGGEMTGADFAAAFNGEHDNNQWRATILTMSWVFGNTFATTIRLESQPVARHIGVAVPVVNEPADCGDAQIAFTFDAITDAGGGHVSAVRKIAAPSGDLPDGVAASSVTQYWSVGSSLVSFSTAMSLKYDTNRIANAADLCVYRREDASHAWEAVPVEAVSDGAVTVANVTHFSDWFVGAMENDDPVLPAGLPDGVSEADRQMYRDWIETNKVAWGESDFGGTPAEDFMTAWLVGQKPVSGYASDVSLRVTSFEPVARQSAETNELPVAWRSDGGARPELVRAKIDLSVGGVPWDGPVNGNVVIQSAAAVTGVWLTAVGQLDGESRMSFTNGVADLAFNRPTNGVFYRPMLSREGRTEVTGRVQTWDQSLTNVWVTCTVDDVVTNGLYTSLAFNADGTLGVCYYDESARDLKYASYKNGQLNVQCVDSEGDVGQYCDLAFTPGGQPAVSYYDATQKDLKYAVYNGGQWVIARLVTSDNAGRHTSLAFTTNGYPAISFETAAGATYTLNYAELGAAGWTYQTLDSNAWGVPLTSLAFSSAGRPIIAYWEYDHYYVKSASYNGASWSLENTYTRYAESLSLAMAPSGRPAVALFDYINSQMLYVAKGLYGWGSSSAVQSFGVGAGAVKGFVSLAFAPDGQPAISYYDDINDNLKYAKYDGAQWTLEVVDSEGDVGLYTSLAFSPQGRPTITYFDRTNGKLKIAEYVPMARVSE